MFNLAKYDANYDIRDRARFLRAFVFPPSGAEDNKLVARARDIFLATKPVSRYDGGRQEANKVSQVSNVRF